MSFLQRPFRNADPYFNHTTYDPQKALPMDKNALDRFFHTTPKKVQPMYKLFFGSPPKTVFNNQTSKWEVAGEWPEAYIGTNLIRTSRVIWLMSAMREMNTWANKIAPIVFTNAIRFDITSKVYDDSSADLIGIGGVPTEVSSYDTRRTESITYAGKAARIKANMLSSPEGIQELWDKLMMMSVAIIKAEIMDFIQTIRSAKAAIIERTKYHNAKSPHKYFEMMKYEWDITRKVRHGIERLATYVATLVNDWGGTLTDMIVPVNLIDKLPFKKEYSTFALAGNRTAGPFGKVDKEVASIVGSAEKFDRINLIESIKGFKVHVVRKFISTTLNLYMHILGHVEQIGSKHHLCNRKDADFSNPQRFKSGDLSVEIYDEDTDDKKRISYKTAAKNSCVYDVDGNVREFPIENHMTGQIEDLGYDTFVKFENGKPTAKPIKLMGETNVKMDKDWAGKVVYVARTMVNHLMKSKRTKLTLSDFVDFMQMFNYLEQIPYDAEVFKRFCEVNWRLKELTNPFQDTGSYYAPTGGHWITTQVDNTGSYKFPKVVGGPEHGRTVIPFGMATLWGIEALSKIIPENLSRNYEKRFVDIAKKFVESVEIHVEWLRRALPECEYLKNAKQFSPHVFESPKDSYNWFVNGIINSTNWLWMKHDPFGSVLTAGIVGVRDALDLPENVNYKSFIEEIRTDSSPFPDIVYNTPGIAAADVLSTANTAGTAGNINWADDAEEEQFSRVQSFIDGNQAILVAVDNYGAGERMIPIIVTNGYFSKDLANGIRIAADLVEALQVRGQRNYYRGLTGGTVNLIDDNLMTDLTHLFNTLYTGVNSTTMHGIYRLYHNATNAFLTAHGVAPLPAAGMTKAQVAELLPANDGTRKKYLEECDKLLRAFWIYANSRRNADVLAGSKTTLTTLALSPELRKSIMRNAGQSNVKENEMYEFGGRISMRERFVDNPSDTHLPNPALNTMKYRDVLRTGNMKWSYHNFYMSEAFRLSDDDPADRTYDVLGEMYNHRRTIGIYPENIIGKCEETAKSALSNMHDPFIRSNIITLCLSKANRKNNIGLYENGACPLYEYLFFRNGMEYETLPIIFIAGGGQAAFRARGNPMFTLGMHSKHAVMSMRYAQSMGTVVLDEKNIYNHENSMVIAYNAGSGTRFIEPEMFMKHGVKYYDPVHDLYPGDMFAVEVPLGFFTRAQTDIDITGHYFSLMESGYEVPKEYIYGAPLYPTALRFINFWGLGKLIESVRDPNNQYSTPNTLCSTGRTWYEGENMEWNLVTSSKTHWGDACTKPGIASYRNGRNVSPDDGTNSIWG